MHVSALAEWRKIGLLSQGLTQKEINYQEASRGCHTDQVPAFKYRSIFFIRAKYAVSALKPMVSIRDTMSSILGLWGTLGWGPEERNCNTEIPCPDLD